MERGKTFITRENNKKLLFLQLFVLKSNYLTVTKKILTDVLTIFEVTPYVSVPCSVFFLKISV